jgi:sugar O-acyltransferase (sialic acid O-acetyltransferase NeuD family)
MNHEKLLIVGAGGHGKVVCDIARLLGQWKSISFLDDDKTKNNSTGMDIIGGFDEVQKYIGTHDIIIAFGNNAKRKEYFNIAEKLGASIPSLIHPKTTLAENVIIGAGTVIVAGVIINTHSKIGKGCIINTASSVGHDNKIDDFVHIASGSTLAGTVHVKTGSWLGLACIISNNISITNDCVIAAGAVVVSNITQKGTYAGVPAKKIK